MCSAVVTLLKVVQLALRGMEDIGAMETVFGELARASEGDLGVLPKRSGNWCWCGKVGIGLVGTLQLATNGVGADRCSSMSREHTNTYLCHHPMATGESVSPSEMLMRPG